MKLFVLFLGSVLVALGRFTVPGHALTGWPGTYEALAHMWVGALILLVVQKITNLPAPSWRKEPIEALLYTLFWTLLSWRTVLLLALIALEIVKFRTR